MFCTVNNIFDAAFRNGSGNKASHIVRHNMGLIKDDNFALSYSFIRFQSKSESIR